MCVSRHEKLLWDCQQGDLNCCVALLVVVGFCLSFAHLRRLRQDKEKQEIGDESLRSRLEVAGGDYR